jgi:transposase-like protein
MLNLQHSFRRGKKGKADDPKQDSAKRVNWKALSAEQQDFLRPLIQEAVQQVLEAEMDEALGAEKGERTPNRLGYRSGHYGRTLVTRVGKLEFRVPQDRQGRFRTEVFEATSGARRRSYRHLPRCMCRACPPEK